MITDLAVGGMSYPLINVAHWLILHKIQGIYQKINTNRLEPKNARPNWVWLVEGKDKGGQATGLAVENQTPRTRLWIKKKGIWGNPHPGYGKKANGTHQPFDGDGPHDPSSVQRGGPTAAFWPNPSAVRECNAGTGRADSRVLSAGATGSSACRTTWRWVRSKTQSIAASSPSWPVQLNKVEWTHI